MVSVVGGVGDLGATGVCAGGAKKLRLANTDKAVAATLFPIREGLMARVTATLAVDRMFLAFTMKEGAAGDATAVFSTER